jgi:putative transposase
MARAARPVVTGLPLHVIQRGNNRQAVFLDDQDRRDYLRCLADACIEHGLSIHAYVLMDNHVHLLCTPEREGALSGAMQALGRRYVRHFNRRHARTGTLWEGRFRSSLVEADRYLLACHRYIELNPVRAGRVEQPEAWVWSSHRHHLGLAVDPLVRLHPVLYTLGNTPFERESAYRRLFEEGPIPAEGEWLTQCLISGKPTASTDFQRAMEAGHGLKLTARPVGRPKRLVTD